MLYEVRHSIQSALSIYDAEDPPGTGIEKEVLINLLAPRFDTS